MANTYLTRTPSSTGNRKILTISCWFKRSNVSSTQTLFANGGNSYNRDYISFESNQLVVARYDNAYIYQIKTNRVFRDINSWYHLMVAFDTTEDSSDNRIKIYINGVRETSFATNTRPALNVDTWYNYAGYLQNIGVDYDNAGNDFNGSMSYVALVDGKAELPTIFGETDSATGQWKIKTSIIPSSGWGTNGFLILKNGNSVTDQSGNSNNFTVAGGTLTKTEDCPSNVFCTFNPLLQGVPSRELIYSNGNGTIEASASTWMPSGSTLAVPPKTGKWYWEFSQFVSTQIFVGLMSSECNINLSLPYQASDGLITYFYAGRLTNNGSETESYFTAISAQTDVIGVALDMTAGTYGQAQFYRNGSATGAAVSLSSAFADKFVMPFGMCNGSGRKVSINTGNGYFGTTAVSSAGTAASTPGIFEYDVPTGYQPLSTKGLNA